MSCSPTLYSSDSSMPYLSSSSSDQEESPQHLSSSWDSDEEGSSYFVTRTTRHNGLTSCSNDDDSDSDNNDTNAGIAVSNNLSMPSSLQGTVVQLVAPANMPAGYQFVAQVDHGGSKEYLVQVPAPVCRGETFWATIIRQRRHDHDHSNHDASSPLGTWRDGLFLDCFRFGIFHPSLCMACWCSPLLLAQVMARLDLNMWGQRPLAVDDKLLGWTKQQNLHDSSNAKRQSTPWTPLECMTALLVLHFGVIETALSIVVMAQIHARNEGVIPVVPTWTYVLLGVRAACRMALFVYLVTAATRTRQALRHQHEIAPPLHGCAKDACLVAACLPCVTAQMARHTADYETHDATCCSPTGLSPHAPV